jgi:hypothetical protein
MFNYLKNKFKWALYESTKPRRWIWTTYYDFIGWLFPEDSFYIMNCGYALLTDDGLMNKFSPLKHEEKEIYQYQLYYAVTNMVNKKAIANKKVIDLSCGRGGGTFFVSSYFNPKKIFGVDCSRSNITACRDTFVNNDLRMNIKKRQKMRNTLAKKLRLTEIQMKDIQQYNRNRTQSVNDSWSVKKLNTKLINNDYPNTPV